MKKIYIIFLYFGFFVPFSIFYKTFKKPIFIEKEFVSKQYQNEDKIVVMINEERKQKKSMFIKLLEIIVPMYS